MRFRVAAGLLRLWVVLSVLWLAGAGAYIVDSYQNAPLPYLMSPAVKFDDLVPAYEHCWVSDGKKVDPNDFIKIETLRLIAECERTVDRWAILKTGTAIALGIPIAVFIIGWGLVWAFRGFLPATRYT